MIKSPAVIIAATGPSLNKLDPDLIARNTDLFDIITVNDAYQHLPFTDHVYACDDDWWEHHYEAVNKTVRDSANLWTCSAQIAMNRKYSNINFVAGDDKHDFDISRLGITYGSNSGFQAVNLAYFMGYSRVYLVGYDMGHSPDEPKHFFGEHPPEINRASDYGKFIRKFNKAAMVIDMLPDFNVYNCTETTRLMCFERFPIGEAILREALYHEGV